MAGVHVAAAGSTAALLRRLVAAGASLFLVRAKAVNQVAEMSAGTRRTAARSIAPVHLQLNQRLPRIHAGSLRGIEELQVIGPHQFHIADRTRTVQQHEKVLKKLEILFEFLLCNVLKLPITA